MWTGISHVETLQGMGGDAFFICCLNTFIYPATVQFSTRLVFVVIQHQFHILQFFKRYSLINNCHGVYI